MLLDGNMHGTPRESKTPERANFRKKRKPMFMLALPLTINCVLDSYQTLGVSRFSGFMASSSALWDGDTPQRLPQVVYPRKSRRFAKMGTEGTLQRWPNFGGEWWNTAPGSSGYVFLNCHFPSFLKRRDDEPISPNDVLGKCIWQHLPI